MPLLLLLLLITLNYATRLCRGSTVQNITIPGCHFRTMTSGPWLQDNNSRTATPGPPLQDHNFRTTTRGSWLQDHDSRITTSGPRLQDRASRTTTPGPRLQERDFRIMTQTMVKINQGFWKGKKGTVLDKVGRSSSLWDFQSLFLSLII